MVTKEKKEPKQRKASKQPKKNSKKDSIEAEERFAYEPKRLVKCIICFKYYVIFLKYSRR
ncbi:Protein CBG25690 [Caenorhabditis briggsae]|uniref:Protein CBG25690 n=1 Tax=Caenorhabditis briggsae TaxID=6238 RepID=B6ILN5_CAEBR|nr:Protein CBG25690 [Caenorhabditis briggsae]CAS00815.1 Protein CBG25690 [Caenorhabditis briggsae]